MRESRHQGGVSEQGSEQEFAAQVRQTWGRPELSDAERMAFDARLARRLSAPMNAGTQRWRWAPALATAAVMAAVLVVWRADHDSLREGGPDGAAGLAAQVGAAELAHQRADFLAELADAQGMGVGESGEEQASDEQANDGRLSAAAAATSEDELWRVRVDGGLRAHLPADYRAIAMLVALPEAAGGRE